MAPKSIFYAWQTDSDASLNRSFIEDCVKRAIRKLNREDLAELVIDRDTKNVPGMPDIGNTILEKIAKSAVVIADLTLINPDSVRRQGERPVSNPNVLFELGCAYGKLGPNALVGVFNSTSGTLEELPFDLRSRRLMVYRLAPGDDKTDARTKLVEALVDAIRQCLGDTQNEQVRQNSKIYRQLSELKMVGTEIGEWSGIQHLQKLLTDFGISVRVLAASMSERGYADPILGLMKRIARDLDTSVTLALNEENWPTIQKQVISAADHAALVLRLLDFKMDQSSHDEFVDRLAKFPALLNEHIESVQNGQLRLPDLEELSHELRMMGFAELMPQHPQFGVTLDTISLDLRRLVLQWTKNKPKSDEAETAIRAIRDRLSALIATYASTSN